MDSKKESTSNIFRILRTCMGLSLNEMSKRCGVSAIYLSELELGKKTNPSEEVIEKIANACGLKTDTILFFIEQQKGDALDYQRCLLDSLEVLASKMKSAKTNM